MRAASADWWEGCPNERTPCFQSKQVHPSGGHGGIQHMPSVAPHPRGCAARSLRKILHICGEHVRPKQKVHEKILWMLGKELATAINVPPETPSTSLSTCTVCQQVRQTIGVGTLRLFGPMSNHTTTSCCWKSMPSRISFKSCAWHGTPFLRLRHSKCSTQLFKVWS